MTGGNLVVLTQWYVSRSYNILKSNVKLIREFLTLIIERLPFCRRNHNFYQKWKHVLFVTLLINSSRVYCITTRHWNYFRVTRGPISLYISSFCTSYVRVQHLRVKRQDMICLFVCLGFIIPLENFTLIRRRHHYLWRAANSDLIFTKPTYVMVLNVI